MSALSDFFTTDTAPWWGAAVLGIAGTAIGSKVSDHSAKKREAKQAADRKEELAQQNSLDDRRRWEAEVRSLTVLIDKAIQSMVLGMKYEDGTPEVLTAESNEVLDRAFAEVTNCANELRIIAPRRINEAVGRLHGQTLALSLAWLREDRQHALIAVVQGLEDFIAVVRAELRIPDST